MTSATAPLWLERLSPRSSNRAACVSTPMDTELQRVAARLALRTFLAASFLLLSACAEEGAFAPPVAPAPMTPAPKVDCVPITRRNWELDWSEYVERQTMFNGKPMKIFSPSPGAHRLIRDSDAVPAQNDSAGTMGLSGGRTPTIFDGENLQVGAGEILEREVPGAQPETACVTGTHARVYWTNTHKKVSSVAGKTTEQPFSTIFIEGVTAGETTLVLGLAAHTTRKTTIVITEAQTRSF